MACPGPGDDSALRLGTGPGPGFGRAGGTLNDWSAEFNWYPTYHLKLMFNAILADLKGAKPVGILQMRLQVAY